ncbi:hypothetical protein D1BOALGB6SA_8389 [Olavius sp. associated proteobacterium Delta 1]|nr:hypothetical protein D1BOALGB6SA_8389 [Olavius sp. associated proteobacterium Delta 1]
MVERFRAQWLSGSRFSATAGSRSVQFDRKRIFYNVSYDHRRWPQAASLIVEETVISYKGEASGAGVRMSDGKIEI